MTFFYYAFNLDWASARNFCRMHHSNLAHVPSAVENDLATEVLGIANVSGVTSVWLGGSALLHPDGDAQGNGRYDGAPNLTQWFWHPESDHGPFSSNDYSNWVPTEPNNGGDSSRWGREFCLSIWAPPHARAGFWNDWTCTNSQHFICEQQSASLDSPLAPPPINTGIRYRVHATFMLAGDVQTFDAVGFRNAFFVRFPMLEEAWLNVTSASVRVEVNLILSNVADAALVAHAIETTALSVMMNQWFSFVNGGAGVTIESIPTLNIIEPVEAPAPPPLSPPPPFAPGSGDDVGESGEIGSGEIGSGSGPSLPACHDLCSPPSHYDHSFSPPQCTRDLPGAVYCGCYDREHNDTCLRCPSGQWMGVSRHRGTLQQCIPETQSAADLEQLSPPLMPPSPPMIPSPSPPRLSAPKLPPLPPVTPMPPRDPPTFPLIGAVASAVSTGDENAAMGIPPIALAIIIGLGSIGCCFFLFCYLLGRRKRRNKATPEEEAVVAEPAPFTVHNHYDNQPEPAMPHDDIPGYIIPYQHPMPYEQPYEYPAPYAESYEQPHPHPAPFDAPLPYEVPAPNTPTRDAKFWAPYNSPMPGWREPQDYGGPAPQRMPPPLPPPPVLPPVLPPIPNPEEGRSDLYMNKAQFAAFIGKYDESTAPWDPAAPMAENVFMPVRALPPIREPPPLPPPGPDAESRVVPMETPDALPPIAGGPSLRSPNRGRVVPM